MLLRPEFTKQLVQQLLAGENINLISPHGQGRRRTLEDIITQLPDEVHFFQIDLKRFQGDVTAWFVQTMAQIKTRIHPSILVIHNGDEIGETLSSQLELVAHVKSYGVLCISENEGQGEMMGLKHLLLPAVTQSQLILELKRRGVDISSEDYAACSNWLLQQASPYSCLDTFTHDWYKKEPWKN